MVNRPPVRLNNLDSLPLSRRELLLGAGGLVLAGTLAGCGSSGSSPSSSAASTGTPKPGGNFRLGVTGGGSKDIMDGQTIITKPDQARLVAGWETLLVYDSQYKLPSAGGTQTGLAEEVTQDAPDQWTIKLRPGITFHNGKPLTADDVIYSLNRILDPEVGLFGGAGLASIDPKQMQKLDTLTVRLKLKGPDSTIADQLGQYYNGIVPDGYTRTGPLKWVGTGPYTVVSFKPGAQSVHKKNPDYWRTGQPYFDQVTITDFADPTAQVNALLAGQIDAMTDIPFAQIEVAKQHGGLSVLESQGGGWLPLCMAIDLKPFDDVRVRQAMRLIVDRNAMLEQVLSGHGHIANDLYSPFDPAYDTSLPQRTQDIEQAKSLLKSAGQEGLTFDLHTTDGAAGMVDSANVFAQQAKAAGVTVNVHNDPNYYGDQYLKLPFSVDFWGTRNFLPQVANGSIPTAPYNECHWPPKDSNYLSLYSQALAEIDQGKRADIIHEMQKLEYDEGGYIIPFFNNLVDSYSSKVQGFNVNRGTLNLDSFGHGYRTIWFG
ncbi:MAG: peptide/nickel transport system substrate-binding protein [Gaiellales bacterium]|jgi:peptide/nickel transport system substrate-binding protein|nr:peptide/nickel transport system substrate-binding protein [Gaiellales bacterium]MDX6545404.1 peptide/nickel transport system substrate-binding protein [Gaiellales bacterium]